MERPGVLLRADRASRCLWPAVSLRRFSNAYARQSLAKSLWCAELCVAVSSKQSSTWTFRNRAFRRTLLCHKHISVDRTLHSPRLWPRGGHPRAATAWRRGLSWYRAVHQPGRGHVPFRRCRDNCSVRLSRRARTAGCGFASLCEWCASSWGAELAAEDRSRLAANLLKAFSYSVSRIELYAWIPPL